MLSKINPGHFSRFFLRLRKNYSHILFSVSLYCSNRPSLADIWLSCFYCLLPPQTWPLRVLFVLHSLLLGPSWRANYLLLSRIEGDRKSRSSMKSWPSHGLARLLRIFDEEYACAFFCLSIIYNLLLAIRGFDDYLKYFISSKLWYNCFRTQTEL